jgi:hypothetical protein
MAAREEELAHVDHGLLGSRAVDHDRACCSLARRFLERVHLPRGDERLRSGDEPRDRAIRIDVSHHDEEPLARVRDVLVERDEIRARARLEPGSGRRRTAVDVRAVEGTR